VTLRKKKSRLASVPSPHGDAKDATIKPHQLQARAENWHLFRLFALENRSNQSEASEVIMLALDKYKDRSELIGPKIYAAFDKWRALAPGERVTYEDC
jgi:hypothetical protein